MNVICFDGNVGKDGELRYLPNGDAILSFSVALSSGYGEKKLTSWMNCSLFGKRAESVAPFILKGSRIGINGEFSARPWKSKEGIEKLSLEVRVADVTLLGGKSTVGDQHSEGKPEQQQRSAQSAPSKPAQDQSSAPRNFDSFDDDIPF